MSDPGEVEGKKAQNDVLRRAAENPKLKLLVEEFAARTEDPSFRTRTVTMKSLEKQIQRVKAKALHKPKAPRTFDDLQDIPDEFKVTVSTWLFLFFAVRIVDCRPDFRALIIVEFRPGI
jgi:hypothetical protein